MVTPTLVGGQWVYTAVYPSFIAHLIDSGHRYRVSAATNASNMSSTNCAFNNNENTMLNIMNCSGVLDVKLLEFNGVLIDKIARLKWISSNENNFSHYEIEKSLDGQSFQKIGTINGAGGGNTTTYNYADINEVNTRGYYRLKMVNKDGLFKYSEIILVSNKKSAFTISGYTNPFRDFINLSYTLPNNGKVSFHIIDMYGKTVYVQEVNGKKDLNKTNLENLSKLSAGTYSLIIFYKNESITKRILKIN